MRGCSRFEKRGLGRGKKRKVKGVKGKVHGVYGLSQRENERLVGSRAGVEAGMFVMSVRFAGRVALARCMETRAAVSTTWTDRKGDNRAKDVSASSKRVRSDHHTALNSFSQSRLVVSASIF